MERFLYGGDIIGIVGLLEGLGEKYEKEFDPDPLFEVGDFENFTSYMFTISNKLVNERVGWLEISSSESRYQSSSKILKNIDQIGFIYLDDQETDNCEPYNKTYAKPRMNIQLAMQPKKPNGSETCFVYQDNSICLPASAYDSVVGDCIKTVTTFMNFENEEAQLFPSFSVLPSSNQSYITGLSVNNGLKIKIADGQEPVRMSFHHPDNQVG